MLDTNPPFWDRWEHLGYAVVLRAVQDYSQARRLLERRKDGSGRKRYKKDGPLEKYDPLDDMWYYARFFRSRYFGAICPGLDGHQMFAMLESGLWRKVPRTAHHAKKPTYMVYEHHGHLGRERIPLKGWRRD